MIRVTYVLSALLVLAGIASVAYGLPEVHLESGWTAVISGTVAGSAGCVIFVLGALLARLDALGEMLAASAPVASARPAKTVAEPARAVLLPVNEPAAELVLDEEPASPPAADVAADVPVAEPRSPLPLDLGLEQPAITPQITALPPNEPVAPARKRPNFLASFLSRRAAQREDDLSRLFGPGVAPEPFAHDPDAAGRQTAPAPEVRHDSADEPRQATSVDTDSLRPSYGEEPGPDYSAVDQAAVEAAGQAGEEGEPDQLAAPEHPLRPSVVGRYTAGSASYIMYSNGMIEVETESGTHQFNSMQELKTFIENQESARV